MTKNQESTSLSEFLLTHDVPCTSCGYNLRGGNSLACPECGSTLPYKSLNQLVTDYDRFQRVETVEYRMYRQVSAYVIIALLLDAILILFAAQLGAFRVRFLVAILIALSGAGLAYLRHKLYTSPVGADYVTDPRAESIRDRFGALCLIMAIPVTALSLYILSAVR